MTDEYMHYAKELKNKKLFELEELYQNHLDDYIPMIQAHFLNMCEVIRTMQKNKELGELSYLEYTLLFTSLVHGNDTAQVRVYDKNWYFDPKQRAIGSFGLSFFFVKYRELWTELLSQRKRFAGAVTAQETIAFLLSCAAAFYQYIAAAFRFSILPCVESEPFLSIQRANTFEINVGEYMAFTEAVYKENRTRSSQKTLDWFSLRLEFAYAYEDFCGLDFSNADLSEIDLRYAGMCHTLLQGTDFQDALLYGTRFCNAVLRDADFRYCQLYEADFTGADLTNARFRAAEGYRGVPDNAGWLFPGYRSISFRNANLSHADFQRTKIRDADFTGAIMDGTMMERKTAERFALSDSQRRSLKITDQK
ncbi:MAG: pentapeptide repeat-containing protein [Eubacterium sp.]|nr:pentapeptide repeat-containing protein [Eubacterium sp.]